MQFSSAVLITLSALLAPSLVTGAVISGSRVEARQPDPAAAAAGTKCSTVAGAVGVSVVCDGPNGKTIDGQPAKQVKQHGLQPQPQPSKAAEPRGKTKPSKANGAKQAGTSAAAGTKCSTVPGAVGVSVVCDGPNGKTIDGQPAKQVKQNGLQ